MKYKLLKRMGLCMLNGMLLLGAVSYPCMVASATSSQMSEIDRVLTEETTELIKSTAEQQQQQGTRKTASQTKWNRNPDETSVTRQTYIGSGTTKIEIFYSSSVESPQILLQAPSKKIYHPGMTTAYEDTLIVYRKGYVVADYPDIKYDILYISESQDPGMWDIAFTVDETIDEFMVITARVADDWENFHTDYKTAPTDIIIWEMSKTSHYTANDITSIVAKDEVIPKNHITETVVIETKSTSPIILAVVGVIALVILGTVVAVVSVNRAGKARNREKSNAIKNANKRLRLKKKKENETLDKVLEAYESQYSDDDYFASFNGTEPGDADEDNTINNNTNYNTTSPMSGSLPREREQDRANPHAGYGNVSNVPDATAYDTQRKREDARVAGNGNLANVQNTNRTKQANRVQPLNAPMQVNRPQGGATHEVSVERGSRPMQGRLGAESATQKAPATGAVSDRNTNGMASSGNGPVNNMENNMENNMGYGRYGQMPRDDKKLSAMGAKCGAVAYNSNDIPRSNGKFSSASPTIPESNPRGGMMQTTYPSVPGMAQGTKPSWMIAAENAKNNPNKDSDAEDFF